MSISIQIRKPRKMHWNRPYLDIKYSFMSTWVWAKETKAANFPYCLWYNMNLNIGCRYYTSSINRFLFSRLEHFKKKTSEHDSSPLSNFPKNTQIGIKYLWERWCSALEKSYPVTGNVSVWDDFEILNTLSKWRGGKKDQLL